MKTNGVDFSYEKRFWERGFERVAGMDEVGRGSFAGPVVAGLVCYPFNFDGVFRAKKDGVTIDDSKKLNHDKRIIANRWIRKHSLTCSVGVVGNREIDKIGIKKATEKAFRSALVNAVNEKMFGIDYLLIDGYLIPRIRQYPLGPNIFNYRNENEFIGKKQCAIKRGDSISFSIASASIIAKVYRDELMKCLPAKLQEKFNFYKNKGYGTKEHVVSLKTYGISRYHRITFTTKLFEKLI
jgi:ribonuclease HII